MKSVVKFRGIQTDTVYFPPGETLRERVLFEERESSSRNLVESLNVPSHEVEPRIVKWILETENARSLLFNQIKIIGNIHCADAIAKPIIDGTSTPGDIDLIAYHENNYKQSIAFQCKLVNVRYKEGGEELVNKIEKLRKLFVQSNKTRDMGFYQTYAVIICIVDGRNDKETGVLFRGLKNHTFKRLYEFPYRENLHNDVGLIFIEIIQPTGADMHDCGFIFVAVDKPANQLEQSEKLTERIIRAKNTGKFFSYDITSLPTD